MCNSCNVLNINGINCHETGCPESWKDEKRECDWCGMQFLPEEKFQSCCSDDCWKDFHGCHADFDYYCDECNGVMRQDEYEEGNGLCLYCIEKKEL